MNGDDVTRSPRRRVWLRLIIGCAGLYLVACTALILRIGFAPASPKYRPEWTRTHVGQIVPRLVHAVDAALARAP